MTSPKPDATATETVTPTAAIALADLLRQNAETEPVAVAIEPPAGQVREIGGRRDGPEPTRYGDWEKNGRCIDF